MADKYRPEDDRQPRNRIGEAAISYDDGWQDDYFKAGDDRDLRRRYFAGAS